MTLIVNDENKTRSKICQNLNRVEWERYGDSWGGMSGQRRGLVYSCLLRWFDRAKEKVPKEPKNCRNWVGTNSTRFVQRGGLYVGHI